MKIKVGDYDVYESGTIIGNLNEHIDFILEPERDFYIRLKFVDDESINEASVKASLIDKNGLVLLFTNFNDPLGIGTLEPIKLGGIKGRQLFLSYNIQSISGGGKVVQYTFLLGKEAKRGE